MIFSENRFPPPIKSRACFSGSCSRSSARLLDLADAELLQHKTLVERLALARPDLAQEELFECDLGVMDPDALRRPVDVARWNLGLGHERHAAVAEIGEAYRVPGCFRGCRLVAQEFADVDGGCRDHR